MINRGAVEKYKRFVDEAVKGGGKIVIGGKVVEENKGYYVEPTVVTSLPYDHWLWKTELFVPILLVGKVKTLEEALMRANDVEYGLTAGIFSEDPKEIEYFFNNIEAGVVYANKTVGGYYRCNARSTTVRGLEAFGLDWEKRGRTLLLTLLP
jgi:1-pyrroline-5-carboxylate dehydrogenase